jgi:Ca-activated chloride channel family protein
MRRAFGIAVLFPLGMMPQDSTRFRADVDLVLIPCSVTDARGAPVHDLTAAEFRVFDDGAARPVRHLWVEGGLPLSAGVILDRSASQRSRLREHEAAVEQFLAQVIHAGDHAFVAAVDENVVLRSEVTGGPRGLRHKLLPSAGEPLGEACGTLRGHSLCGGTALWNAVYAAAKKLRAREGAKALLLLTDGNDTGSTHSADAALEEVEGAGATVYAIRYPDALAGSAAGADGLTALAERTGGILFQPPGGDYAEILRRIESDLRSRYVLGIPAADSAAGVRHRLRVEVARPGLTVRHRAEYLAPPAAAPRK